MDAVVGAVGLVAVACVNLIGIRMQVADRRNRAERQKEVDERDKRREEEETTRQELIATNLVLCKATADGTEVLLHKAHGDHINGNVDAAIGEITRAKAKCSEVQSKALGDAF